MVLVVVVMVVVVVVMVVVVVVMVVVVVVVVVAVAYTYLTLPTNRAASTLFGAHLSITLFYTHYCCSTVTARAPPVVPIMYSITHDLFSMLFTVCITP